MFNQELRDKTVKLIESKGTRAAFMRADVCDSDQMKSAFAEIINRFGRFNILFNKAGITTPQPGFTRLPIFTGENPMSEQKRAKRLAGKVAIVTGAGRGIGRCEALLLAEQGAKVVVNDLGGAASGEGADKGVAQSVVDEIKAAGGAAVANTDSVTTMAGGKAIIDCAIKNFGRLDILINNAGILRPRPIW